MSRIDMMDSTMGPCDPAELFKKIVEGIQAEVVLYTELACTAPGTCLGPKISNLAASKACAEPVLAAVAGAFGFAAEEPQLPPPLPFPPTAPVFDPPPKPWPGRGQNFQQWLTKAASALELNLTQAHRLTRLAAVAPDEVSRQQILELAGGELQDALFFNNLLCAFKGLEWSAEPANDTLPPCHPGFPFPGIPPCSG